MRWPSAPTPPGSTSRSCCAPAACRCSRSTPTARPADFDVLAFNLSAELVYTNLLNCIDLAGVPVRAADRRPEHPLIGAGGHCTYNPEPLADFLDFVVLGDGEEVVGEITEVVGGLEGLGPHRGLPRARAARAGPRHRRLRAVDVRRAPTRAPTSSPSRPATPTCPSRSRSAPSPTWPTGPYPKNQLVPLTEVVHDRLNVEVFRGCTRGCRFCQAGMITRPVRERPAEQVRTMVDRGPAAHRLRRGRPHLAVDRRLLAASRGSSATSSTIHRRRPARCRCRCPACGSTPSPWASPPSSRRPAAPASPSPPRPARGACARSSTSSSARKTSTARSTSAYSQGWRRMKLYFLTGLPTETDEDTLGIAELARNCVELGKAPHQEPVGHGVGRRLRAQAVHPVPVVRAEHRSRSCSARSTCCATTPAAPTGVQLKWHDPKATWSRASSAAATAGSARSSRTCGGTAARSRSGREHFDLQLWLEAMASHGLSSSTGTSTATAPSTRSSVGPPLGRPPQGLPLAGLARRPRRGRPRGLPLDPLLRLRRLHRLRHRAHRGLGHAAGRRQPGHRPGPQPQRGARHPARPPSRDGRRREPDRRRLGLGRSGPMRVRFRFSSWARSASPATATSPAAGSAPCAGPSCRSPAPKVLAPPEGALRAGPVHRPRVAGRVPRHRPPRARSGQRRPRRHCPSGSRRCSRPASTWKPSLSSTAPRPRSSRP